MRQCARVRVRLRTFHTNRFHDRTATSLRSFRLSGAALSLLHAIANLIPDSILRRIGRLGGSELRDLQQSGRCLNPLGGKRAVAVRNVISLLRSERHIFPIISVLFSSLLNSRTASISSISSLFDERIKLIFFLAILSVIRTIVYYC